jgi:tetratricopeptide (TPR) repeat protein
MYRALGDISGLWGVLCNSAEIEFSCGNAERSVEMVQEILASAPKERNRLDLIMLVRSNLAGYLLALGRTDDAKEAAQTSLRETRNVGGRPNYALNAFDHLAVVAAELGQFERSARLLGYADRWHVTHPEFFRDFNEQRSSAQTRTLLAAALSVERRDRLMREGSGWTEDKATEEALAI